MSPTDSNGRADKVEPRVEKIDDGSWVVVADVDGERKQSGDPHGDEETAQGCAQHYFDGSDRWTGAACNEDPETARHPGED